MSVFYVSGFIYCWADCRVLYIVKLYKWHIQHDATLPLFWMSLFWVSRFIYYYAECRYAEGRYAEGRYAECRGAIFVVNK
jgi:hypothetical protein